MHQAPQQRPFERRGWGSTFSSLSYRPFLLLWITTVFSSAGNWIQQVTLSWLAYEITESPVKVAIVLGARTLPMLSSPLAGALADRFDRKRLLVIDHIAMVVIAVAFAADILLGQLQEWHMYVFSFVSGATWSMNNPVRQSLVANSVPRESLTNAIALNSMAFNSMRMVGPMVGGGLIYFFGPGWNFMIQALMYVFVLVIIIPYKTEFAAPRKGTRPPFFSGLLEGFKYIKGNSTAASAMLMSFIPTITMMAAITSLMSVFAAENLGDPEGASLGLLLGAMGTGGFIGTILLARFSRFEHKGRLSIGGALGAALSLFALALAPNLPIAMLLLGIQQVFFMTIMMSNNTILQSTTPDELRGRVMGVYMLDIGFQPLGGVIAGIIAAFAGVPAAWMAGAVAGFAATIALALLVPSFRQFKLGN